MPQSDLVRGMLVGLVFGVPAGAVGALTIQRSLTRGFWAGLLTGMGSSAADVLYACVGVFGLTVVSDVLLARQNIISFVGGGAIVMLGIAIFRKKSGGKGVIDQGGTLATCFASSFAIAIANPATILSFVVAFATLGIGGGQSTAQAVQLLCGILLGTGCWWAAVSGIASHFRGRVTAHSFFVLNRLLGSLMALFGLVMILRSLLKS